MKKKRTYRPKKGISTRALQAGKNAEMLISKDLEQLKSQGKILGYRKFLSKNEDQKGCDFFINDINNVIIPLQVKNNPKDQVTHALRFPDIPSISPHRDNGRQRRTQLLEIFSEYAKGVILHLTFNFKKPLPSTTKTKNPT